MKIICQNRKAHHDYDIGETYEAGIILAGTEVKALREGRANLKDSYVIAKDGEAYLLNCHIGPYSHGNIMNHDPLKTRKLLFHKKEILKLMGKVTYNGFTLVPLKIYFKGAYAKIDVALAKGKRLYEKRDRIKEREAKREIERAVKKNY